MVVKDDSAHKEASVDLQRVFEEVNELLGAYTMAR
jgi:hypothetical protein